MKSAIIFAAVFMVSDAIVCLPKMCAGFKSRQPLNCKGSIIKNGGFCGCTDVCAKVEGEDCEATFFLGGVPKTTCDEGLECVKKDKTPFGKGVCVKKRKFIKREATTQCEQMRTQNILIMVIRSGQWMGPNCDPNGNFLPEQCDRSGYCYCVTPEKGHIIPNSKVKGHANCLAEVV